MTPVICDSLYQKSTQISHVNSSTRSDERPIKPHIPFPPLTKRQEHIASLNPFQLWNFLKQKFIYQKGFISVTSAFLRSQNSKKLLSRQEFLDSNHASSGNKSFSVTFHGPFSSIPQSQWNLRKKAQASENHGPTYMEWYARSIFFSL